MARTQAQTDSVRKAAAASAKARAAKAGPTSKAKREKANAPQMCQCECGDSTKGGEFCIGHDARRKSGLIKAALLREGGYPLSVKDAEAELGRRGWTKFLEKSRNVAVRVPSEHKEKQVIEKAAQAEDKIALIKGMKDAADKVRLAGRNGTQPGNRITVTRDNYEAILAATVKELKTWPANEVVIEHVVDGKGEGQVEEMVG
jgi:hypothetical protein